MESPKLAISKRALAGNSYFLAIVKFEKAGESDTKRRSTGRRCALSLPSATHSLECCFPPTSTTLHAGDFNEMLCVMSSSRSHSTRESSSSLDCGIDVVDKLLLIPNAHRQKSRLSNIFIAHTQEVSLCTNGVELEPYRRHNSIHRYCT